MVCFTLFCACVPVRVLDEDRNPVKGVELWGCMELEWARMIAKGDFRGSEEEELANRQEREKSWNPNLTFGKLESWKSFKWCPCQQISCQPCSFLLPRCGFWGAWLERGFWCFLLLRCLPSGWAGRELRGCCSPASLVLASAGTRQMWRVRKGGKPCCGLLEFTFLETIQKLVAGFPHAVIFMVGSKSFLMTAWIRSWCSQD